MLRLGAVQVLPALPVPPVPPKEEERRSVSPKEAFANGGRSKKRRPSLGSSVHGPRHANNETVAGGEGRDAHEDHPDAHEEFHKSPLHLFHQHTGLLIDFGMFFFAWANAGVRFNGFGAMSLVVLACLLLGKVLGIMSFAFLAVKLGCPLPEGMAAKHIFTISICAALGLTVALFVAGEAFSDANLRAQAKMGALMSLVVAPLALGVGRCLRVHDQLKEEAPRQRARGRGLSLAVVGGASSGGGDGNPVAAIDDATMEHASTRTKECRVSPAQTIARWPRPTRADAAGWRMGWRRRSAGFPVPAVRYQRARVQLACT